MGTEHQQPERTLWRQQDERQKNLGPSPSRLRGHLEVAWSQGLREKHEDVTVSEEPCRNVQSTKEKKLETCLCVHSPHRRTRN